MTDSTQRVSSLLQRTRGRSLSVACLIFLCGLASACGRSLDSEAVSLVRDKLDKQLLRCGASWYGVVGDRTVELRGVGYQEERVELTPAQRANGIEHQGKVMLVAETFRWYKGDKQWDEWMDWATLQMWPAKLLPSEYRVERKGGQWSIRLIGNPFEGWTMPKVHEFARPKFSCNSVPG